MQKKKTHQLSPEVKTKGIITLWTIGEHDPFKRAEKKRNTFKVSIAKRYNWRQCKSDPGTRCANSVPVFGGNTCSSEQVGGYGYVY